MCYSVIQQTENSTCVRNKLCRGLIINSLKNITVGVYISCFFSHPTIVVIRVAPI